MGVRFEQARTVPCRLQDPAARLHGAQREFADIDFVFGREVVFYPKNGYVGRKKGLIFYDDETNLCRNGA